MEENMNHLKQSHDDHGSVHSYVIGFVLSLIFTIIPYYLVTEKVLDPNPLLYTILIIGLLQMFVQIFFFLHLGRGPKPLYNVIFFGATAGLIVLVVGASIFIMDNLYKNMSPSEVVVRVAQEENIDEINGISTGACQGNNANHTVVISENGVSPQMTEARRCDTLSFSTEDGIDRELVFTVGSEEVSYGGMYEITARGDRSKIITLNEIGTFSFEDPSNENIMGVFSVSP